MTTPVRIGINGFGRMGRLALRAAWACPGLHLVHVKSHPYNKTKLFLLLLFCLY